MRDAGAVEVRLTSAGLRGGLHEVLAITDHIARQKGLPGAWITTDAKQLERGLTDKSDAMSWVMRQLARRRGIAPTDILIVGDEFGPIAGCQGNDHGMVTPLVKGATVVSVGPEPGGTPPGVMHLGGEPATSRGLPTYQAMRSGLRWLAPGVPSTHTADPCEAAVASGLGSR